MSGPEEKKAVNSPQDKKTAVLEAVISLVMEKKPGSPDRIGNRGPGGHWKGNCIRVFPL